MSCNFDKDIIQKYIDNTIDPLEYIFLKEHLVYCKDCQRELKLLEAVDSGLGSLFSGDFDYSRLDAMAEQLISECISQLEEKKPLTLGFRMGVAVSKEIIANSFRFAGYLPGSRQVKKGIAIAATKMNDTGKAYLKNRVKKVFSGQHA